MGASGRAARAPVYTIESREGPDHEPLFTVSVEVGGFEPATRQRPLEARRPSRRPRRPSCCAKASGQTKRRPHERRAEGTAADTRSGFVALIGAPNAGKSTLVNQLVGAKVSIVTHKVQTTRAIVRGIATHDNAQIVFVDTPGIFKPQPPARHARW